jgi:hypothetical protein
VGSQEGTSMKINVTPGPRGGYRVQDEHGNDIPSTHMCLDHDGARVELLVREFTVQGAEVTHWDGLEQIPTTALLAELDRRGDTRTQP